MAATITGNGGYGLISTATAQTTTSGTAIDFSSIPAGVRRITVLFNAVSINSNVSMLVQIGSSGGIETTGYVSSSYITANTGGNFANYTTGYGIFYDNATFNFSGSMVIQNVSGNIWVSNFTLGSGNALTGLTVWGGGTKTLSGALDRVRLTTTTGTPTFDNGSVNIFYE